MRRVLKIAQSEWDLNLVVEKCVKQDKLIYIALVSRHENHVIALFHELLNLIHAWLTDVKAIKRIAHDFL